MPETPRTSWVWTPRSTAVVVMAVLVTTAWVAVGATMLFSGSADRGTPVAAAAASIPTPSAAVPRVATPKPVKLHYHSKRYRGPLHAGVAKAPVAVAHPPQVTSAPSAAPAPAPAPEPADPAGNEQHQHGWWPGQHHGHHHHGGHWGGH